MPNLVELYTIHGPMLINTAQLCDESRSLLTIYTMDGSRKQDVALTERERLLASYGVHRENLYASRELAITDFEKMVAALPPRKK